MRANRCRTVTGKLLLAGWLLAACGQGRPFKGEVVEPAKPAPHIGGVNWNGAPFRLDDLQGRFILIFFGYTYCPDVCPFTLSKLKNLYAALGDRAENLEMVFISVDPERDTVEKLAGYVPAFDARFYGIRIEPKALSAVTKSYGVEVQRGPRKNGPGKLGYYYVDHTGTFFLVDPEGRLRLKFPPNTEAGDMLADLLRLMESEEPKS